MDNRTCTGCGTVFTPTHGRQRCCSIECRKPTHAKVTLTCDGCGGAAVKYKRRTRRYASTYCSVSCRDDALKGSKRCSLPSSHWARWYGKTSAISFGECEWCGGVMTNRPGKQTCSRICKGKRSKARRAGREHGARGEYRWSDVMKLWMRTGQQCAYCLTHLELIDMQVEHVTPLSRGGRNDMTNILPACAVCNGDKCDRTPGEWDQDRERRGLPLRSSHINSDDARFSHLVTIDPIGIPYRDQVTA